MTFDITSVLGTLYTWAVVSWDWDDARALKTWATAAPISYTGTESQTLVFNEQLVKDYELKAINVALAYAELGVRLPEKITLEAFNFVETYIDEINFNIRIAENLNFAVQDGRDHPDKEIDETVTWSELPFELLTQKIHPETVTFADVFEKFNVTIKILAETLNLAEVAGKTFTFPINESFNFTERFLRNAQAIYADLQVLDHALTVAEFTARVRADQPLGFEAFTRLIPGDREYQNALLRMVLSAPNQLSGDRVGVDNLLLNVDVPDVLDSGIEAVAINGETVSFNRTFNVAPEMAVVPKSGGSPFIIDIGTITTTGFDVECFEINNPANSVAGTISWTAKGH